MSLRRSLSLAGITAVAPSPRERLAWAASAGYRAVALDGTSPGLRARDLDRSGRRDVAAILRRAGLECSGVDLWVPREHWQTGPHTERALAAVLQAMELVSELCSLTGGSSRAVVSVCMGPDAAGAVVAAVRAAQEQSGTIVADHAWPAGTLPLGVDPAVLLGAGQVPQRVVSQAPEPPASARLTDVGPLGRVEPGTGSLDLLAYEVALVTRGYADDVVVDLRGLTHPGPAAERLAVSP